MTIRFHNISLLKYTSHTPLSQSIVDTDIVRGPQLSTNRIRFGKVMFFAFVDSFLYQCCNSEQGTITWDWT